MSVSRRAVVAAGAGAALGGCDGLLSTLARLADAAPAVDQPEASSARVDPLHTLLGRAGYGPRPGEVSRLRARGAAAWLDEQLHPERLDDTACNLRTGFIDAVGLPRELLLDFPPEQLEDELRRHTLLRAVYSRRQLAEAMTEFWSDHFNVALAKASCRQLKVSDDVEVLRPLALGAFQPLLRATLTSPAMLVYLDGRDNRAGPGLRPNENHARELLELHTLGVHGGYSQADVQEVARCLSGWVVDESSSFGAVRFVPERHDDGGKTVLGVRLEAGGGVHDVDRLAALLAGHQATARFLVDKLARTFVSSAPSPALLERGQRAFTQSGGQLAPVLSALLLSEELVASGAGLLKRPFRLVASALRMLEADTHARGQLLEWLGRLGQLPFGHPTPDGYPLEGEAWLGTLVWRWGFAHGLAHGTVEGVTVDPRRLVARGVAGLAGHLWGRRPGDAEAQLLASLPSDADRLAVLLAAPGFQVH